jgi:hypothetical protein
MNSLQELIEFEERYRPYFNYAASLGNYTGFYGPPTILNYMIWRSLFAKNITMSFCFGDEGRDDYYLFQDFIHEKSMELSAWEVDIFISQVECMCGENGWRFLTLKKSGYKILLSKCGGIMLDDFLNHIVKRLLESAK